MAYATRLVDLLRGRGHSAPDTAPLKHEIVEALQRIATALTQQIERRFEEKLGAVHASMKEKLDDLYSETWRLRDALDSRLGSVEQRLGETVARVEASVLEFQDAFTNVKETCGSLSEVFDRQFVSAEKSLRSLRDSYERRLQQLESRQDSRLSLLKREHRQALEASSDAQRYVLDRVRALAGQMLQELERTEPAGSLKGLRGFFLRTKFQEWLKSLKSERAKQLESALRMFAQRLGELGQMERGPALDSHSSIPVSPGCAEPALANSKVNGNGHHSLKLDLGGLTARG